MSVPRSFVPAICAVVALTSLTTLPFAASPSAAKADEPLRQTIDRLLSDAWQREKLTPTPLSSDAEFLRRVSLDLLGVIPSIDETTAFLNDAAPNKRETVIQKMLDDPRFARHQADIWDMILFGRNPPGYDTDKRYGFQNWMREQFAQNIPYDVWARQILKAEGNTVEQGAGTFFLQYRNQPEDASEAVTQTFLGIQLQCARCHDHPFEKWTQTDFYGLAAFLSRLEVVTVGKKDDLTMYAIAEKSTGDLLFTGPAAKQTPGKKGEPIKPKFLQGDALAEPPLPEGFKEVKFETNKPPQKPVFSRKDQLADWITDPARNPFFARAIANRIWAQFFGRGLVHPVDNMSPSNVPTNPELLDKLTADLVARKFDLKGYITELCNSRAYQLSGRGGSSEAFPQFYQHARVRPLSAEELIESWRVATGFERAEEAAAKKKLAEAAAKGADDKKEEKKKDSDRKALEDRYRPLGSGYLLRFFGNPNTGTGDFQGGLHEHLYLNNGPVGSVVATGAGGLLSELTATDTTVEQRVERMFLAVLNRQPASDESERFAAYVQGDKDPTERWREALWVLMTCSEFRFNH